MQWEEPAARLYRAAGEDRDRSLDVALLDVILAQSASVVDEETDAAALKLAAQKLAARRGLRTGSEVQQWCDDQGIGAADWPRLLNVAATRGRIRERYAHALDAALIGEMQRSGVYARWKDMAQRISEAMTEMGVERINLSDWGVEPTQLQAWYEQRHGPMLPDPESHARALGFATMREFLEEVAKAFVFESRMEAKLPEPIPLTSSI